MNSLLNWLDDRTGFKALMHEALYERVPGGARWRYVWGSTLVFTFSVQLVTGTVPVDVLQPQFADRLGERVLSPARNALRLAAARRTSLHRPGNDRAARVATSCRSSSTAPTRPRAKSISGWTDPDADRVGDCRSPATCFPGTRKDIGPRRSPPTSPASLPWSASRCRLWQSAGPTMAIIR